MRAGDLLRMCTELIRRGSLSECGQPVITPVCTRHSAAYPPSRATSSS